MSSICWAIVSFITKTQTYTLLFYERFWIAAGKFRSSIIIPGNLANRLWQIGFQAWITRQILKSRAEIMSFVPHGPLYDPSKALQYFNNSSMLSSFVSKVGRACTRYTSSYSRLAACREPCSSLCGLAVNPSFQLRDKSLLSDSSSSSRMLWAQSGQNVIPI